MLQAVEDANNNNNNNNNEVVNANANTVMKYVCVFCL
jgi:hypothetical protein